MKHSLKQWQLVWRTDNSPSLVFIPCHRPAGRGDGCLPHASPVSSLSSSYLLSTERKKVCESRWLAPSASGDSSVRWTFSTLSPVCVDIYLLQHLTAQCLKKRLCAYYYYYYKKKFWLPIVPGRWCASVSVMKFYGLERSLGLALQLVVMAMSVQRMVSLAFCLCVGPWHRDLAVYSGAPVGCCTDPGSVRLITTILHDDSDRQLR